jgi:hypothetical protein
MFVEGMVEHFQRVSMKPESWNIQGDG